MLVMVLVLVLKIRARMWQMVQMLIPATTVNSVVIVGAVVVQACGS